MTATLQAPRTTSTRADGITAGTIDVRALPPQDRHALIFATLGQLAAGQSVELVNDHDPSPLRARLAADEHNTYSWTVLEAGPQTWRIAIGRPAANTAAQAKTCCGGCGGGGH